MKIELLTDDIELLIERVAPPWLKTINIKLENGSFFVSFTIKKGLISYSDSIIFIPAIQDTDLILKVKQPLRKINKLILEIVVNRFSNRIPFDINKLMHANTQISIGLRKHLPDYLKIEKIDIGTESIAISLRIT